MGIWAGCAGAKVNAPIMANCFSKISRYICWLWVDMDGHVTGHEGSLL